MILSAVGFFRHSRSSISKPFRRHKSHQSCGSEQFYLRWVSNRGQLDTGNNSGGISHTTQTSPTPLDNGKMMRSDIGPPVKPHRGFTTQLHRRFWQTAWWQKKKPVRHGSQLHSNSTTMIIYRTILPQGFLSVCAKNSPNIFNEFFLPHSGSAWNTQDQPGPVRSLTQQLTLAVAGRSQTKVVWGGKQFAVARVYFNNGIHLENSSNLRWNRARNCLNRRQMNDVICGEQTAHPTLALSSLVLTASITQYGHQQQFLQNPFDQVVFTFFFLFWWITQIHLASANFNWCDIHWGTRMDQANKLMCDSILLLHQPKNLSQLTLNPFKMRHSQGNGEPLEIKAQKFDQPSNGSQWQRNEWVSQSKKKWGQDDKPICPVAGTNSSSVPLTIYFLAKNLKLAQTQLGVPLRFPQSFTKCLRAKNRHFPHLRDCEATRLPYPGEITFGLLV